MDLVYFYVLKRSGASWGNKCTHQISDISVVVEYFIRQLLDVIIPCVVPEIWHACKEEGVQQENLVLSNEIASAKTY